MIKSRSDKDTIGYGDDVMHTLANTSIENGFDSVFSEIDTARKLNIINENSLRLFYLDIINNEFSYSGLFQYLQRNIGRYVFSRATIEQFRIDGDIEAVGLKAVELLRKANNLDDSGAGGELGEMLLYLFLEQKLCAPKLLSKVELKTSGNQYVFGSDAVHLLRINDSAFQLVLGESKIKGDLEKAVDDAFVSIKKVAEAPENELRLIDKNILSESFDEATTTFIRSLIVPTKRDKNYSIDNSFGIFLGYSIDIDKTRYSNSDYRVAVLTKLKENLDAIGPYIEKKINKSGLCGYSFYFYILPFNDAPQDRAKIIQKLKGEN